MQRPKQALIRLGRGYSAVGTAVEERDPRSGRRMLHLRLSATDERWLSPLPAGHA